MDLIKGIDKFIELAPVKLLNKDWKNYAALKAKLFPNNYTQSLNNYVCSTH